ncbi:MAG: class I SAM-dependent methyltransferase [Casimicrobiaceae bacterium]
MLDVGCGFGFALDFWQRTARGEAVGLERADYGREGAKRLGVTIHGELLEQCDALAGRRFDIVYASEVIEHVPDPGAFAALLCRWVADDGVLILTTPAASFISTANQSTTLLAALAPGFHGFLLSSDAFSDAIRRAGFFHVEVRTFNERQVAWASRRPLRIDTQSPAAHAAYLKYLAARVDESFATSSPVWQGFAYRYGKELVHCGRLAEADAVLSRLLAALKARFGAETVDPIAALARIMRCTNVAEFGQGAPYFLPCLFYFLGALAQHGERDAARALNCYAGAVECTLACGKFGSIYFLEALSLLWPARARQAELLLASGDIAAGVALFARLAGEGGECDARNGFAVATRELLELTVPTICEGLWTHGYRDQASMLFSRHKTYLSDRYGTGVLNASDVDARLGDAAPRVPLDPLFAAFWLAREALPSDDALAEAAAVRRVGEAHATDPVFGSSLRAMAERAQRLAADMPDATTGKPTLVWSSSASYRQRSR